MEERTLKAIRSKIGIARNEFRSECFKYVTTQEIKTSNKALAVHAGHGHIWAELYPKLEAGLIEYCLRVGSRDVDFITGELKPALTQELHTLGWSLANSYQTPATVGLAKHSASVFESDADLRLAGLHSRVLVAVEERRHSDPPAPMPPAPTPPVPQNANSINHGVVNAHTVTFNSGVVSTPPEHPPNRLGWKTFVVVAGTLASLATIFEVIDHFWPREPKMISPAVPTAGPSPVAQDPLRPGSGADEKEYEALKVWVEEQKKRADQAQSKLAAAQQDGKTKAGMIAQLKADAAKQEQEQARLHVEVKARTGRGGQSGRDFAQKMDQKMVLKAKCDSLPDENNARLQCYNSNGIPAGLTSSPPD